MNNRLFYSPQRRKDESTKNISTDSSKKNKIDIKSKKENTIKSLNEVEFFLNDFKLFKRYLHLYKFLK